MKSAHANEVSQITPRLRTISPAQYVASDQEPRVVDIAQCALVGVIDQRLIVQLLLAEPPSCQTDYFDNQGNLVRVQTRYAATDLYYNPANGVILSGKLNATLEWDASTGEITGRGLGLQVTVPGYGPVLMFAGRQLNYPDGPKIGLDTTVDPKAAGALCSLLAGN